ncbi:hypothetical protein ACQP2Y_21720 [Actinoplanes sp. CA-051413]|uniref:hypothetical protein n=1 Tax=Actinoplanes sp. CA-051413 TaxID=3239899 RepID=UPI003D99767A
MGTNFFYRTNVCGHCDRYQEVHVGKRSAGWSFGFRGYPHTLFDVEHPEWGYDTESPFGFPVLSRADWRKVFADTPGELWDEYGRRVDEPAVWLDQHEAPDDAQIRKEEGMTSIAWWVDGYSPGARSWRDAEGFRFDVGEFS